VQHIVERTRLGVRLPPVGDEELRAEIADVPGREVALRQHIRPGPVEQRRLAIVVGLLERGARRDFLRTLMDAEAETGMTLLLSSHIIADLERVCDYLIILSASRVQLAGDIQEITQTHWRVIGQRQEVLAPLDGLALRNRERRGVPGPPAHTDTSPSNVALTPLRLMSGRSTRTPCRRASSTSDCGE